MARKTISTGIIGEEKVQKVLTISFPDALLINDITLLDKKGNSHQIDHLLIKENGVFVIETKNFQGLISGKKEDFMWEYTSERNNNYKIKFRNPIYQNKGHIKQIKRILGNPDIIFNFVVFVNNNINHLGIFQVCDLKDIAKRIACIEIDKTLSKKQQNEIYETIMKQGQDVNIKDHIENVKELKEDARNKFQKKTIAIEQRICPDCGEKILTKGNSFYCSKCEFKFTLK